MGRFGNHLTCQGNSVPVKRSPVPWTVDSEEPCSWSRNAMRVKYSCTSAVSCRSFRLLIKDRSEGYEYTDCMDRQSSEQQQQHQHFPPQSALLYWINPRSEPGKANVQSKHGFNPSTWSLKRDNPIHLFTVLLN